MREGNAGDIVKAPHGSADLVRWGLLFGIASGLAFALGLGLFLRMGGCPSPCPWFSTCPFFVCGQSLEVTAINIASLAAIGGPLGALLGWAVDGTYISGRNL